MLNKATTLKGYALHSLDGDIGRVKEFYFDDRHWTIRYLVADTGNWLSGRQVLITPHALVSVMSQEQSIAVELTQKQIEDSPSLDRDKPVSRQFEEAYSSYYGYPVYWGGPCMWGSSAYPLYIAGSSPNLVRESKAAKKVAPEEKEWDFHLRSTHAVNGYHIEAADGPIGHIQDFIIDDETWAIRYLMVDTVKWWPGKKVLVAARWIERVSWDESKVFINLSRAAIKQAPEYTEESLLTRDYEIRLHGHYNREGYWVDEPVSTSNPKEDPGEPK
jgi:hypothetical protein